RGENRVLVAEGLRRMRAAPRPGLAALCRVAGVDPADLEAWHLAFLLAPRLNAAGRMSEAGLALRALLAVSDHAAQEQAALLEAENQNRRRVQEQMVAEVQERMA